MNAEWIKSPTARRVLVHWTDPRPAWLWSADGKSLLWRNEAARFFNAKLKKSGPKLGPEPVPIKGQVARLIRLGSPGRSSLSRIQFLAGEKPVSATCSVTPLERENGDPALLIVGVDPVDAGLLETSEQRAFDGLVETLFPSGSEYLLFRGGQLAGGSRRGLERFGPALRESGPPALSEGESADIDLGGVPATVTSLKAGPNDAVLLLIETPATKAGRIGEVRTEEGLAAREEQAPPEGRLEAEEATEPLLPLGLPPVGQREDADPGADHGVEEEEYWAEPLEPAAAGPGRSLSSLFDRLAEHDELYAPLPPEVPAADEAAEPQPLAEGMRGEPPAAGPGTQAVPQPPGEPDLIGVVIEFADDEEDDAIVTPEPPKQVSYRVIGRGFTPLNVEAPPLPAEDVPAPEAGPAAQAPGEPTADAEVVERVSRYNFDELSRILTDRVGSDAQPAAEPVEIEPPIEPVRRPMAATTDRALVNVAAETFILNRLPIGIMVFRDQQVLFANRALTDLTGYESIEALRSAGLASIFPSVETAVAGPVTQLVNRSGKLLPVTARLQSITWQGRPALMLSASLAESRLGHEGAARSFAEALAELRSEGFIAADRAGVVTRISARGCALVGGVAADIVGKPLRALISAADGAALKRFLEQPARFAETVRPSLAVKGMIAGLELLIFAEGQAGIVSGYFGFVRPTAKNEQVRKSDADIDPSMLARVSRGIRRPLNTIIGFSDLIRSAAFGSIENQRYVEYARDIKTAGQEISVLVDELDDFTRLKEGRYSANPADLDLGSLLETSVIRVRTQAAAARVLVRSAISERLPRIRADEASMRQAVLNLLASAIDETPAGGTVVLSAQVEDDGSIAVNVRDNGSRNADPGERFVVFRDGTGRDGEILTPVRSSVGLALTRSLLAVNACSLSVDPIRGSGTLFSLVIPAEIVAR